MKSQRGFSLIELLIVVVVIGIVAAVAIPNYIGSRRAANEGSTVAALRTLYGANMSYAATVGSGSYAGAAATPGASSLNDLASAHLIDDILGTGAKSGYSFIGNRTLTTSSQPATFYFSANPSIASGILMTGTKRFGVATDGVLRVDATAANLAIPFDAVTILAAQPMSNP